MPLKVPFLEATPILWRCPNPTSFVITHPAISVVSTARNIATVSQSALFAGFRRPLIPNTSLASAPTSTTTTTIRSIKSINGPRPSRFDHHPNKSPLASSTAAALARKRHSTPLRTGLLAQKRGMTAIYDPSTGARTPCTVLQLDRNEVVAHKTRKIHGYWAVQVGCGERQFDNVSKPMLGHFARAGTGPKRWVAEFKVRDADGLGVKVGEEVGAGWFSEGAFVDVRGNSRGMGFAGGMKRHGFSGQPASHGQSLMHRGMGSAGGSQGSGSRVIPGKRMPGRMGNMRVTVKNLQILKVDAPNGIVVVNGCVPGPKHQLIHVQDAIGKPWPKGPMTTSEIVAMDKATNLPSGILENSTAVNTSATA